MDEQIIIMGSEPSPGLTLENARELISKITDEKSLAETFSLISNKAWWIEDEEYDYEEGTPEHEAACRNTDAWFGLMKEVEGRIFKILMDEGIEIPKKGTITVLDPFMRKNGFYDANGWWLALND